MFAKTLMDSRRDSGSRIEIVRLEGFKLENPVSRSFLDSRKSRGLCLTQNFLSASSFLNFGNFSTIPGPLFLVHVSCRYYPDLPITHDKHHGEKPGFVGLSESKVPFLPIRVLGVQSTEEWVIEKDLLTLHPFHFVLYLVLLPIPRIPFKFDNIRYEWQRVLRLMYIYNIYVDFTMSSSAQLSRTSRVRVASPAQVVEPDTWRLTDNKLHNSVSPCGLRKWSALS